MRIPTFFVASVLLAFGSASASKSATLTSYISKEGKVIVVLNGEITPETLFNFSKSSNPQTILGDLSQESVLIFSVGIYLRAQGLPMLFGTPKLLPSYLMERLALRRASLRSRPAPINSRATVRLSGFTERRTQMGKRAKRPMPRQWEWLRSSKSLEYSPTL